MQHRAERLCFQDFGPTDMQSLNCLINQSTDYTPHTEHRVQQATEEQIEREAVLRSGLEVQVTETTNSV